MIIQLNPEQERIVQEEIQSGKFKSPDEVLDQAFAALRESRRQPKSLVQFFRESPFVGMEMEFERSQDAGRKTEL